MEKFDVVVIGSGVAGAVAALTAHEEGASVALISNFSGATVLSSGAIDVATGCYAGKNDYLLGMERIAETMPRHPYTIVGQEQRAYLNRSLALLQKLSSQDCPLSQGTENTNLVLATQAGTLRHCAMAQSSQALNLGALPPESTIGVVGIKGFLPFDSTHCAKMLAWTFAAEALVSSTFIPCTVPFLFDSDRYISLSTQAARCFNDMGVVDKFSIQLKSTIKNQEAHFDYLLFPPIMGHHAAHELMQRISLETGILSRELLALPQSVPGLRMSSAISSGLKKSGIHVEKSTVNGFRRQDERIVSCSFEGPGNRGEIQCSALVLATGRFLSGGFSSDGFIRESIFSLPVWLDSSPIDDLSPSAATAQRGERQQLFSAGIRTDQRLRPIGKAGQLFATNLFAAGSILGGYDPAADGTGIGVCTLTGYIAGKNAAAIDRLGQAVLR